MPNKHKKPIERPVRGPKSPRQQAVEELTHVVDQAVADINRAGNKRTTILRRHLDQRFHELGEQIRGARS
jgi:hypothetical protein